MDQEIRFKRKCSIITITKINQIERTSDKTKLPNFQPYPILVHANWQNFLEKFFLSAKEKTSKSTKETTSRQGEKEREMVVKKERRDRK